MKQKIDEFVILVSEETGGLENCCRDVLTPPAEKLKCRMNCRSYHQYEQDILQDELSATVNLNKTN